MTTERSARERLAIRVLRSADCAAVVHEWRGPCGVSLPKGCLATDLPSGSAQTTGKTKVGVNPRLVGNSKETERSPERIGTDKSSLCEARRSNQDLPFSAGMG